MALPMIMWCQLEVTVWKEDIQTTVMSFSPRIQMKQSSLMWQWRHLKWRFQINWKWYHCVCMIQVENDVWSDDDFSYTLRMWYHCRDLIKMRTTMWRMCIAMRDQQLPFVFRLFSCISPAPPLKQQIISNTLFFTIFQWVKNITLFVRKQLLY